jgi:hypothetical protein
MPMFDRPPIDEDPLMNPSKFHVIVARIVVGVVIVGFIVLVILDAPLGWDQTYGSP